MMVSSGTLWAVKSTAHSLTSQPSSAAAALDGCDVNEWAVLFTAHNVPLEPIMEGDPSVEQLQQTISQLVPALALEGEAPVAGHKGRGGGEWLEPEADDMVRALAEEG